MAACVKIASCNNQISAIDVFMRTLLIKRSEHCPAILVTPFNDPVECYAATCAENFSHETIIKEIGIEANSGSIAVAVVNDDLEERITCTDNPSLATLLNESFTQSTDCKTLRVQLTDSTLNCTNQPCDIQEPLESIIKKTFMKSEDSECTVILITEKEAGQKYASCVAEGIETTLRKLLVPSDNYPGHYAWVVNGSEVSSDTCYVFAFDMVSVDDEITSITYNNGTEVIDGLNIALKVILTTTNIEDFIKAALDTVPITYNDVTVSRIDIGGGLFTYTITFINTNNDIGILDISGTSHAATTTDCT